MEKQHSVLLLCECVDFYRTFMELFSLIASIFATFVTLGYWVKPRLRMCIFQDSDYWKVKVVNRNLFRSSVKDVCCEIALSKTETFEFTKTSELKKGGTLVIYPCPDEYIFKTHKTSNFEDYKYIRIRLIAPNFLGVRKVFQRIEKISAVPEGNCKPICEK